MLDALARSSSRLFPVLLSLMILVGEPMARGGGAEAQPTPGTDIWVVELQGTGTSLRVGDPLRATDRDGYDNQPSFTPDGSALLYTSIDETGQADIWRYDFASGQRVNLTRTAPESEYSATVVPGGERFSVIRVEADSTQRLWSFELAGSDPRLVLREVQPVGYHAWIDDHTLALFVLGSPATLQIADSRSQTAGVRARDIGRSLHKLPRHRLASFLQWEGRGEGRTGTIKTIGPDSDSAEIAAQALEGSEDYAWTPDGILIMGSGSKLYALNPAGEREWREIADLAGAGIEGITRLAVSPDGTRLAVVGSR